MEQPDVFHAKGSLTELSSEAEVALYFRLYFSVYQQIILASRLLF